MIRVAIEATSATNKLTIKTQKGFKYKFVTVTLAATK